MPWDKFSEDGAALPPTDASRSRRTSSRSKRDAIIATATEYFGRQGYEYTKWADVAEAVGIGSTALYHYFESKLHCLYAVSYTHLTLPTICSV